MDKMTKYFTQKRVNKILDIGTGKGEFVSVLKKVFPNSNIIGVDPGQDSLTDAKCTYPEVQFKEMVAENLDFFDNSFDVVSISMAMHHLPEIEKSFSEIKRVLVPNGWLIINELFRDNLNKAQEVHKLYHHFKSAIDRIIGNSHNETFKKDEILNLVRSSGVKILFHFENHSPVNLISSEQDLQEYVKKMKLMLQKIQDRPEFKILEPKIARFKEEAVKYGFEMATRVVVVGQVDKEECS